MNSKGYNNNINITSSQEIGIECDITDHNINIYDQNNIINNDIYINNQNQPNQNNLNYPNNGEQEEKSEEEEEIDEEQYQDNIYKYNLVPRENFSQQVDFLYHPDNPEYLPPKIKNKTKTLKKSKSSKVDTNKKLKKKKSASKINKNNKIVQKIRPEFNNCTKIDPLPKTQSLFYGPSLDETKCQKQLRERAQKIAEYEENFWRQKEIYKAKRQKEQEELQNRYKYIKSRTSNNFYSNYSNHSVKSKNEFLKEFNNLKIEYPETDIRNYECNPQKYDGIIHSLLKEISEIKFQRKKENEQFVEQIKKLENDLDKNKAKTNIKKRPKSGNKTLLKKNKQNNNNVFNIIKNYYKPYKSRAKTGKKLNNKSNQREIENEIPIENNNPSKNSTMNNYYQKEREKILKNIQDLENQKNAKMEEIIEQNKKLNNSKNKSIFNNNSLMPSQLYYSQISNNGDINNNINQNINYNINNGYPLPAQINIMNNVNINALNYQEKMQILSELNNNISKFTSGIPKLVNKVNQTLDKIYGNTDNPIKKAINNHPFVILASKSAYQMIQNNSDILIEAMIDDLLFDCVNDLQEIEEAQKEIKKRNEIKRYIYEAQNNLNAIKEREKIIFENYNFK